MIAVWICGQVVFEGDAINVILYLIPLGDVYEIVINLYQSKSSDQNVYKMGFCQNSVVHLSSSCFEQWITTPLRVFHWFRTGFGSDSSWHLSPKPIRHSTEAWPNSLFVGAWNMNVTFSFILHDDHLIIAGLIACCLVLDLNSAQYTEWSGWDLDWQISLSRYALRLLQSNVHALRSGSISTRQTYWSVY